MRFLVSGVIQKLVLHGGCSEHMPNTVHSGYTAVSPGCLELCFSERNPILYTNSSFSVPIAFVIHQTAQAVVVKNTVKPHCYNHSQELSKYGGDNICGIILLHLTITEIYGIVHKLS